MAFNMLDANHDGRVSLEEISAMLTKMGFDIPREALDFLMQDKSTTSSDQVPFLNCISASEGAFGVPRF